MIIGFIGTTELLLIGGLALLIVGGKKLPEMMRGLGKGVREFKEGMNEVTSGSADAPDAEEQHSGKTGDAHPDASGNPDNSSGRS